MKNYMPRFNLSKYQDNIKLSRVLYPSHKIKK